MKKLFCVVLALLFCVFLLSSCKKEQQPFTDEMFALDTIIRFTLYDEDEKLCEDTVKKCKSEITRLENLLSISKDSSDIFKLNNSDEKTVSVSIETASLIKKSCDISKSCDGAFDITVKPLMTLWGFDTKDYKVPADEEIEKTLSFVSYENIAVADDDITKEENTKIDLGGIAKGYVADRLQDIIKESDVNSALISLGGMIVTVGEKSENENFHIGVEHPKKNDSYFFIFDMTRPCVSTTGAYQRYFEKDGEIYHHILDPESGKPVKSDFSSVTVVGESGVMCDALSTAFYVMGIDETKAYIAENSGYQVVILSSDMKTLYLSKSFEEENIKHEIVKSFDEIEIVYI